MFSTEAKQIFSEPATTIFVIVVSKILFIMRVLVLTGKTGQLAAKTTTLPIFVLKYKPCAGAPPSGSTFWCPDKHNDFIDQNEMEVAVQK